MLVFAEDGQVVVCGSDHGIAYVFSCSNGEKKPLQIMHHGKGLGCCHGIRSAYGQPLDHLDEVGSVVLWEKPLRLLEVKQLSKTERDLADAKDKIELLIFVFVIWAVVVIPSSFE
ncbi:hypothetical protein F5146DRAFT_999195 [Armillaria mellea]|nr:hypothetical protein F5146DRAFT_999195 [Armillaria mellea]